MKLPDQPRKGEAVYDTVTDIINYLRAYRVVGISGGRVETSSNGTRLVVEKNAPQEITSGAGYRFAFQGLFKDGDGIWRVGIGPGCVLYNEIKREGVFDLDEDKPKAIFVKGIYPTIDVDGEAIRIDDESRPTLELGDRATGTVWLVVATTKCLNQSGFDPERLEITDRNQKPSAAKRGETWIKIVDFDVETTGSGETESKKAINVFVFVHDNWEQPYLCEGVDDSSMDSMTSSWPSSEDDRSGSDTSSGIGGGSDSASSDSNEEGDADCQVRMVPIWANTNDCFDVDTSVFPASICVPKKFRFEIDCRFFFKPPFGGVQCQALAYGVSCPGGMTVNGASTDTATEYRWKNDARRTLIFEFSNPPVCQFLPVVWRVKTFPAVSGFGGVTPEDQGCCGSEYSGTANLRFTTATDPAAIVRKLPGVCGPGCGCSSTPDPGGSSSAP